MKNFFTLTLCFFTLSLTAQDAGCTYPQADNYSSTATVDDGTCVFGSGLCGEGTMWNSELELCEITNPTDSNFDGCTGLSDLLNLLSMYGDCSESNSCGDPIIYQGYEYATVQIGEQCWFAENLRAESLLDETSLSQGYVINGQYLVTDPAYYLHPEYNYEIEYGKLYNAYTFQNSNDICPQEWHIPNDLEWVTLRDFVGGSAIAGTKLKEQGNQHWSDGNTGDDEYGFAVRGGGWVFGGYSDYRSGARFWSIDNDCSGCPDGCANVWDFYYNYDGFGANHNCIGSDHAASIRCIKD